jgi:transposase
MLRLVRHHTLPVRPTPRILGVDDWAWRKGQRYGTILIDLETHEPVDLLPDRTADTLAQWLQAHPGVEVISRDRSGAYADGASRGAPEAVQVADRFHLLANLRDVLEAVVVRHGLAPVPVSGSGAAPTSAAKAFGTDDASEEPSPDRAPPIQPHLSAAALRYEPTRLANRTRREARYKEVAALHQQGVSQKAIGVRLNLSSKTIRRWLRAGSFPELAPRRKRVTRVEPFIPYLQTRWAEGCHNGAQLWRELCQQGYTGSRTLVADWVAQQRWRDHAQLAPAPPLPPRPPSQPAVPKLVHSPRQLSWLLIQGRGALDTDQQAVLDRLTERNEAIQAAYVFAQDFRQMVKERQAAAFDRWLAGVMASDLPDLRRFASSLQRDAAAVLAALSLPFSNGPVEGHVNRLKFIKRQGYGRAGFELLKRRVLPA